MHACMCTCMPMNACTYVYTHAIWNRNALISSVSTCLSKNASSLISLPISSGLSPGSLVAVLNKCDKDGHLCLVPNLRGRTPKPLPYNGLLAEAFSQVPL